MQDLCGIALRKSLRTDDRTQRFSRSARLARDRAGNLRRILKPMHRGGKLCHAQNCKAGRRKIGHITGIGLDGLQAPSSKLQAIVRSSPALSRHPAGGAKLNPPHLQRFPPRAANASISQSTPINRIIQSIWQNNIAKAETTCYTDATIKLMWVPALAGRAQKGIRCET